MFFMNFDTVQANATKLSRNHPLIQKTVNDYFFRKKFDPPPAKGRTMYLTNEIAAFGSIGKVLNSTP
jgi:hypothetical protein